MNAELLNTGFGRGAVRTTAEQKTQQRLEEKQALIQAREEKVKEFEAARDAFIAEKRKELEVAENELTQAQEEILVELTKGLHRKDSKLKQRTNTGEVLLKTRILC